MDGKKLRQNRQMQIRVGNSETTRLTYTGYPKGIRSLYSSSSKNNLLVAYFRSVNHQLAFFCGQITNFFLRECALMVCTNHKIGFYKDLRQTVLIKVRGRLATLIN